MRDIVIKFLQNNHFNQLDTDFDFYTNSQYSEYFIVSEYSPNELHNFFDDENNEFSFDSDLTKDKPEPLKEFWD